MPARIPLVLIAGSLQELPAGDTIGKTTTINAVVNNNGAFTLIATVSTVVANRVVLNSTVRVNNLDSVNPAFLRIDDSITNAILQTTTIDIGSFIVLDLGSITTLKLYVRGTNSNAVLVSNYL